MLEFYTSYELYDLFDHVARISPHGVHCIHKSYAYAVIDTAKDLQLAIRSIVGWFVIDNHIEGDINHLLDIFDRLGKPCTIDDIDETFKLAYQFLEITLPIDYIEYFSWQFYSNRTRKI